MLHNLATLHLGSTFSLSSAVVALPTPCVTAAISAAVQAHGPVADPPALPSDLLLLSFSPLTFFLAYFFTCFPPRHGFCLPRRGRLCDAVFSGNCDFGTGVGFSCTLGLGDDDKANVNDKACRVVDDAVFGLQRCCCRSIKAAYAYPDTHPFPFPSLLFFFHIATTASWRDSPFQLCFSRRGTPPRWRALRVDTDAKAT